MGEVVKLTVPAEYVETFRVNVYSKLAAEGSTLDMRAGTLADPGGAKWSKFIDGNPDKVERYAVDVLTATRNIAALAGVMEQLGWTDPIRGDVELAADPKVLASLIEGCLVDVGGTVHTITDSATFDRAAFDAATARGVWLADRSAEVEAAVA